MRVLVCCAVFVALGCQTDERFCKLTQTQPVAQTEAKLIDAVAIEALGAGAVLAWSDSGGLFARLLDAQGNAVGEPARIGERCAGGLALATTATTQATVQLACSQRAIPADPSSTGRVQLYALARTPTPSVSAHVLASYAPVGTLSEGVALVMLERAQIALAWHDASPDMHRVWLMRGTAPAEVVSTVGRMAEAPALLLQRGKLLLAWTERYASEQRGEEAAVTSIMLKRGSAKPEVVRERAHISAMPQLALLGDDLVLGFRELGGGGRKVGLHLERLLGEPLRAQKPVRVGRAEGFSKPVVVPCMDGLVTATPRGYSGDYFIGLNWLSRSLSRPRREQQFYEDAHAFTQAATVCMGEHALIALAELPMLDRKKAALHIARYSCEN